MRTSGCLNRAEKGRWRAAELANFWESSQCLSHRTVLIFWRVQPAFPIHSAAMVLTHLRAQVTSPLIKALGENSIYSPFSIMYEFTLANETSVREAIWIRASINQWHVSELCRSLRWDRVGFFVLFAAGGKPVQALKRLELGWTLSNPPAAREEAGKQELLEQVPYGLFQQQFILYSRLALKFEWNLRDTWCPCFCCVARFLPLIWKAHWKVSFFTLSLKERSLFASCFEIQRPYCIFFMLF